MEQNNLRKEWIEKLNNFMLLENNWDNEGALSIKRQAHDNMLEVIREIDPQLLLNWRLFPGKNGTLSLETKDGTIAGIEIGNTTMSLASEDIESYYGKFDVKRLEKFLKEINTK